MVKMVMWRRDCLSCAAVRPLSAPLGAEAWLPYYIALLARVFESAGKLKSTAFMVRYAVPAVGETAAAELSSLLASGLGPQHATLLLDALAAELEPRGNAAVLELVTSGPDIAGFSGFLRFSGPMIALAMAGNHRRAPRSARKDDG
jgi:hypothetical protein